jgi:hypothetical protein
MSERAYEEGTLLKEDEAEAKKLAARRKQKTIDEDAEELKEIEETRTRIRDQYRNIISSSRRKSSVHEEPVSDNDGTEELNTVEARRKKIRKVIEEV